MDFDLEKALQAIDRKIAELQHAKDVLVESFGGITIATTKNMSPVDFTPESLKGVTTQGETRKETIVKLLSKEGSLGRSEIHKKTGIPLGSIAAALNDKKTFISKDGKWNLLGGKTHAKSEDAMQQLSFMEQGKTSA